MKTEKALGFNMVGRGNLRAGILTALWMFGLTIPCCGAVLCLAGCVSGQPWLMGWQGFDHPLPLLFLAVGAVLVLLAVCWIFDLHCSTSAL